jgi:hypothetical protein
VVASVGPYWWSLETHATRQRRQSGHFCERAHGSVIALAVARLPTHVRIPVWANGGCRIGESPQRGCRPVCLPRRVLTILRQSQLRLSVWSSVVIHLRVLHDKPALVASFKKKVWPFLIYAQNNQILCVITLHLLGALAICSSDSYAFSSPFLKYNLADAFTRTPGNSSYSLPR